MPSTLLPAGIAKLPADTCKADGVCAPAPLIADPAAALPSCSSALTGPGLCIASCFVGDDLLVNLLPQASCAGGERCVPCSSLGSGLKGCGT